MSSKEKVIFEVPWSKVLKVSYTWEIPYIYPARLVVKLCSDEFEGNFPDGGGDDSFCTTMNPKTLSVITELLPPNLKEGVNFLDEAAKKRGTHGKRAVGIREQLIGFDLCRRDTSWCRYPICS